MERRRQTRRPRQRLLEAPAIYVHHRQQGFYRLALRLRRHLGVPRLLPSQRKRHRFRHDRNGSFQRPAHPERKQIQQRIRHHGRRRHHPQQRQAGQNAGRECRKVQSSPHHLDPRAQTARRRCVGENSLRHADVEKTDRLRKADLHRSLGPERHIRSVGYHPEAGRRRHLRNGLSHLDQLGAHHRHLRRRHGSFGRLQRDLFQRAP